MRRLSKNPNRRLSNVFRHQIRSTTPGMLLLIDRKCFDCIVVELIDTVGLDDIAYLKKQIRKEIARKFVGDSLCKCRDSM